MDALQAYRELIATGALQPDPAQKKAAQRLAELHEELENSRFANKSSALGWLFARHEAAHPVKGLYIHGAVGRGKTMLMDLFFEHAPDLPKRRMHFHEFMSEVHDRIHAWRQQAKKGKASGSDPIAPVAAEMAATARLLCFDEFHVRDIADAMILGRLFTCLFQHRVTIVATSNDAPADLYAGGLNRALFIPFLDLLGERLDILHLDAEADYRQDKLNGHAVYFQPLGRQASISLDQLWNHVAAGQPARAEQIRVKGRDVPVPRAVDGAARFTFAELCEAPLGAADYLKLARTYHTIFLEDVPALSERQRNAARRFIDLIDALYDNRVRLVASAAAEPAALYPAGDGAENFLRTASRLIEMRSHDYLEAAGQHRQPAGAHARSAR